MHTVLRTTAVRVGLAAAFLVASGAALAAPAGAATPRQGASAAHVRTHAGSGVRIGHAVKYVRRPDGSIKRVF